MGWLWENWHFQVNKTVFAAHFVVYNRNPESRGFGQSIWLAIPIFNSARKDRGYPREVLVQDGAGNPAYFPPDEMLFGSSPGNVRAALLRGETVRVEVDLLRLMHAALRAVQDQRPDSLWDWPADLSALTITHFNIGWESSGPFKGTAQLGGLSLRGARLSRLLHEP